jgi:ABC-type transport system involved in multi-copper enzyme maturation permease subunit
MMGRFIALMIMVIPAVIAGYGIKLMRDTIFTLVNTPYPNLSIQFIVGFILFLAGLSFIGGFIFYRDKKNGKIAPRFKKRRENLKK